MIHTRDTISSMVISAVFFSDEALIGVVICAGISTTILRYGVAVSVGLSASFSSDSELVLTLRCDILSITYRPFAPLNGISSRNARKIQIRYFHFAAYLLFKNGVRKINPITTNPIDTEIPKKNRNIFPIIHPPIYPKNL